MSVPPRRSFEQYKALIHSRLLSTGNMEYEFSIPNNSGQLDNLEKAANAVNCDFDVGKSSPDVIVVTISRRSGQFF